MILGLRTARLNAFRLNNSRLNLVTPYPPSYTLVHLWANGVWNDVSGKARVEGLTITQALNEVPDTAQIRFAGDIGFALKGTRIFIQNYFHYTDDPVLFQGHILNVRTVIEGTAKHMAYECDCIDYTWTLTFKKVTKQYRNTLGENIIADLINTFAAGAGFNLYAYRSLGNFDEITFTNEDLAQAISRVCERAGMYWFVRYDQYVIVFGSADVTSAGTVTQTNAKHVAVNLAKHEDLSPVANFIRGRGGGAGVSSDVPAAAATIPVDDATWYLGGNWIECGPQWIYYASVSNPETGSLVGAGNAPDVAPTVGSRAGNNLAQGYTYGYAVTFLTAAGESLPGPITPYYVAGATIPSPVPPKVEVDYYSGSKVVLGGTYRWALELFIKGGQRIGGQPSVPITVPAGDYGLPKYVRVSWTSAIFNDPAIQSVTVCRTTNNGNTFYGDTAGNYNTQGSWSSSPITDGDLVQMGAMAPTSGVGLLSATLSNIPTRGTVGGTVTGRKIYRTTANGSQLKLLGTIADNSTTTFIDDKTDAQLGANAPAADTSGLKTDGQIAAGSASILVASAAVFPAGGGWVRVGNMVLRYTSVSGSSLVLAEPLPSTLSYGSEIVNAPHLTGVPQSAAYGNWGILYPIKRGDTAYVITSRWDDQSIGNMRAWIGYGDGHREEFFTDGRLSLTELIRRLDALLLYRKDPLVTITFDTRDANVSVGKTITFNTTSPAIAGTFLIQRVQISDLPSKAHVKPIPALRTVEASSRRFTFDDLVQQLKLVGRIN